MRQEQIFLEELSIRSVNIRKQKYYIEEDQEPAPIGNPWRMAIVNSEQGRKDLQEQLQEPYYSAVMNVWGDEPVVVESAELNETVQ